jgi:diguanylate cyclase (GGDEF)-like protein
MKILIAEDERVSARRLESVLTSYGYEVIVARDGLMAWDILQGPDAPKLAILDWMMPGMNGLELCRSIRELRQEPYTFILLLTEKSSRQDVVEGLDAGADDYLTKPFDASELEVRLRAGRRVLNLMDEVIAAREALRQQATHDSLTGLLNRRAIQEALARDLARAEREGTAVGVIMLDLDLFKQINDAHGHQAGDAVLVEVARRMGAQCRPYDALGRYGGEEFLIVLPGCGEIEIFDKADAIRKSIGAAPIEIPPGSVRVTASIGAAYAQSARGVDADELIRVADEALYRAKAAGRNRVKVATSDLLLDAGGPATVR